MLGDEPYPADHSQFLENRIALNDSFEHPECGYVKTHVVIYAAKFGNRKLLEKLVARGLQLGLQGPIFIFSEGSICITNAFGAAVSFGNIQTLKYLIEKMPLD